MNHSVIICGLLCLNFLPAAFLRAQDSDDAPAVPPTAASKISAMPVGPHADKTLHIGDSDVYEFDGMTTAAIGSPTVADIVPLSGHRLLVNAKGVGQTTLFVYDRKGKHRLTLAVVPPAPDLGPVAAQVQADIGLPGVTARAVKDTVFLEGTVTSVVALQRAGAIAGVYAPKLRNLLLVVPAKEEDAEQTLAQTYAALLTANLKETSIKVQVVDDKTIALTGEYESPRSVTGEGPSEVKTPAHKARTRTKRTSGAAATDSSDDTSDSSATMDLADHPKSLADGNLPFDPLDRLLQSLPADLKVINLINIAGRPARQILVHAKIIDINRNASKSLGIQWGTLSSSTAREGAVYSLQSQPILFGQAPDGGGEPVNSLLGGGRLTRLAPFAAQLNALISENKARILSEPSLMVLDGNEGSILVGGEIPIPVAQSSNGTNGVSSSITIEYKPYGVRLLVAASLVGDKAIQMTVTPEVSDLNYGTGVQISGFLVPGLTVRRATSTLQMADGETLVIGGLYSNTTSRQVERIPLLSQIPVLGEFFKNTITRKEESELLILIQPEIVGPNTPGAYPPPSGNLENLPIARPGVGKSDFDKDFPELQQGGSDREKPGPPVALPPVSNGETPK